MARPVLPLVLAAAITLPGVGAAQIVRGQVVDSMTSAPLPNATVSLLSAGSDVIEQTTADDEGLFLLRAPGTGTYRLRVDSPLYRRSTYPEFAIPDDGVASFALLVAKDLGAEAQVRRELCGETSTGRIVLGTLRDGQTGQVVAGGTLHYHMPAVPGGLAERIEYDLTGTLHVDSSGTYVLCGVSPYTAVALAARSPGQTSASAHLLFVDDGVVDGRLRYTLSTSMYRRDFFLAPDTTWHGQVSAIVTDSGGAPIADADVRLLGTPFQARTDRTGRFRIAGVPDGWIRVEVRSMGYRPTQAEAQLIGGRPTGILEDRIVLDPLPIRLADIIVEGRPAERRLREVGFYDRQRSAQGTVLSMQDFERLHGQPSELSEMLRRARRLRVSPRGRFVVSRCSGELATFINRMYIPPIFPGTADRVEDLDQLVPIDDVVGIEVHTGIGIPPRFRRQRNQCGAIVIWTR